MYTRLLFVLLLFYFPAVKSSDAFVELVSAEPEMGFNYPYVLRHPTKIKNRGEIALLVETNNSGNSDDFQKHVDAALYFAANKGIGPVAAGKLDLPLLVPVFPRTESEPLIYTHALDRDTLLSNSVEFSRLDRQLLQMIEHARARLMKTGLDVKERVVMCGFSASGTFANRMALLYPEKFSAVISGGINAFPILPIPTLDHRPLNYPLGTADLESFIPSGFDRKNWEQLPQLLFMGHQDDNDAIAFNDAYTDEDRAIIYSVVGKEMDDRWRTAQQVYLDMNADATFVTYGRVGHWTDTRIANDIANFISQKSR